MGVVTQLEAARAEVHVDSGAAGRRLAAAGDLARAALGDARRSVEGLLPEALDGSDLVDALKTSVDEWSTRTGTAAQAVVTGTVRPVPPEVDSAVLRVAGEALRNVEQHAGARRVGVTLSFMAGELALDVRDDGRGSAAPADGRFGITGMRRRAERLGGDLVVESAPGPAPPSCCGSRWPVADHGPDVVRVVVVDDHPVVRDGLRGMLSAADGLEVVGEAADGVEALAVARRTRPTWC